VWNLPKYLVALGMILLLLEEQIEHNKHLALHDVLTGLPNRRLFQDRLTITLERARRTGTKAALLVLDLDRFKQVNDTLGHHVGDLLLQSVARVFNARIRRSDTVARTGGDEFSVILEGPTNTAEALLVGRSLQELLKEPMELENRSVRTGASFGVAIFPDDAADLEALCIAADQRMYENKRTNQVFDDRYPKTKPPASQPPRPKGQGRISLHL
jgi:diguanylate cyclase